MPQSRVAYIFYQTWAGPIDCAKGFSCQNGILIENSERDVETEGYSGFAELKVIGTKILGSLLESVGARQPSFIFEPFERGFFPNT